MIRLGILEADHLADQFAPRFGSYPEMFANLFRQAQVPFAIDVFTVIDDQYPADYHSCDAYLITGSQFSVYDQQDWILKLRRYVTELYQYQIPIIGICFGHQLIADVLGGLSQRSANGWGSGVQHYQLDQLPPWMQAQEKPVNFCLQAIHQDQAQQLPSNCLRLAHNSHCPIAAFWQDKRLLAFQGHPEFSADYNRALIEKRRQQIGAEAAAGALHSLTTATDQHQVAKWIGAFLQDALAKK